MEQERGQVLKNLTESRDGLRTAVDGLSAEQRSFRPGPDRWSIADCLEHLAVVENFTLHRIQQMVQRPAVDNPETRDKEQVILNHVPGRARRVKAPDAVLPTGRWPDFDELLHQFEAARQRTIDFAWEAQPELLRGRDFPHPFLGALDCHQWLLFLAAHCERHVRQMEEVKGDPAFPDRAGSAMA